MKRAQSVPEDSPHAPMRSLHPLSSVGDVAARPTSLRVLIAADDTQRAALLQRAFARHGNLVDIVSTGEECASVMRQQASDIAIVSCRLWDRAAEARVRALKQHASAQVIVVITGDQHSRTTIDILRRDLGGYVRTSSIVVGRAGWVGFLWTWIAETATTLCRHLPLE